MFYRYGFYFVNGVLVAIILFMLVLIYQNKQESKIMKSPIVLDNISDKSNAVPSPVTPTEIVLPSQQPLSTISQPSKLSGKIIYVSPQGNDDQTGDTEDRALKTIQKAVDIAQPGESVYLLPGVYRQDVISKRSGFIDRPITIKGTKEAIVKGGGKARIFEINHDYISLEEFTIDGLHGDASSVKGYRDKLIYVIGKTARKGVTGLKIISMSIKNAGGECVRLRYFAQKNEIANNTIGSCGAFDFKFNDGGKNGEGIYIGTAPEQLSDGRNPTKDRDESNSNWIHHNTINTQGNECVDIKEASFGNIVEYNNCSGQKDPESGGLDSRGDKNVFRYNQISGSVGAGIRLGGDKEKDGINNEVYGNIITNKAAGGIKIQRSPQGKICDNKMEGNSGGDSVGTYGEEFNPTESCN